MKGTKIAKCGLEGMENKIFLNVNKRLYFREVRDFKKRHGYKAAFCVNGTITKSALHGVSCLGIIKNVMCDNELFN